MPSFAQTEILKSKKRAHRCKHASKKLNTTLKLKKTENTKKSETKNQVLPGVGGVEPRELALFDVESTSLASAPRLLDDEVLEE